MDKSTYDHKEERIFIPCFDMTQTTEAGGELTMPDYYPEIQRVVSVTADALPDSKYLSGTNLEVGGTVAFTLLYVGDDGAVSSVPYVTEYSQTMTVGTDFSGGSSDIRLESVAEAVSCRPLGPRTVSLKAKIKSRVCADCGAECTLKLCAEDKSPAPAAVRRTIERLDSLLPSVMRKSCFATGNLTGECIAPKGSKPVMCKGELLIDSTTAQNGSVTVKGNALVSCLIMTSEGLYKTVTAFLPLEERISADDAKSEDASAAYGRVAAVNVSADSQSDTMEIDLEYDLDAVYAKKISVPVTEDIYSTEYALDKRVSPVKVLSLVCLENKNMQIGGEGRRKSQRTDGDYIISSCAEARIDRVDVRDNKAHLFGVCTFKAIVATGGECITEEFEVPVKFECKAEKSVTGEYIHHCFASAKNVECYLDEGKITGRCELYVYAEVLSIRDFAPVTEAMVGIKDSPSCDNSRIRICYPEKGRRIWDITKEFRAKAGETERTNRITRYDVSDGSPLILK